MAQVTTSIASGDLVAAKKYALYFFIAYIAGSIIGTVGEVISLYSENREYGRLMMTFIKSWSVRILPFIVTTKLAT